MDDTQDEGEGQAATTTTTSPAIHFGSRRGEDAENYDPNARGDEDETQVINQSINRSTTYYLPTYL